MRRPIYERVAFVYGESQAAEITARIETLIEQHRGGGKAGDGRGRLRHGDALLITYGDQVSEPGEAPLTTLTKFAREHLAGVVSGIHILPFYPYSSDDGFSVIDYCAVDPRLGDWSQIRELGGEFALMFDAVFNHISAQSEWFRGFASGDARFREYFVTVEGNPDLSQVVRPRALPLLTEVETAAGRRKVWTTFSADQVDLNARSPDVVIALIEVLLFYVRQGARLIRLDAIAFLWKEIGTPCVHLPQTHALIQLMRAVLDAAAPEVLLITETNVPHPDNISYFGDGTNEAQLVYNFALPPLVLHSMHAGDATALSTWAASLSLPSKEATFFNFLASHDGIGVNPARGILPPGEIDRLVAKAQEHGGFVSYKQNPDGSKSPYELNVNYFDALSNPAGGEAIETQIRRFISAQAIMLCMAGTPGIYFHSLFGSRGDRAGAEATGIPRRINRQKLVRADLERELAQQGSVRRQVYDGLRSLLEVRAREEAFDPYRDHAVMRWDPRAFVLVRRAADGREVLCIQSVHGNSFDLNLNEWRRDHEPLLDLISGKQVPLASGDELAIAPYDVLWLVKQ